MAKKDKPTEAESLETALGFSCKEVQIGGETVAVRKFSLKQTTLVMRDVRELQQQLTGGLDEVAVTGLIEQFPEMTAKWAAYATSKSVDWIESQEAEEAAELIGATIEVNRRFFTGETMTRIYEVMNTALGVASAPAQPEIPMPT